MQSPICHAELKLVRSGYSAWHSVDIFAIPVCLPSEVYVFLTIWWNQMNPSSLLFVPSPFYFAYYSHLILGFSRCCEAQVWLIAMNEFIVLVNMAFVVSVQDRISFFKIVHPCVHSLTRNGLPSLPSQLYFRQ